MGPLDSNPGEVSPAWQKAGPENFFQGCSADFFLVCFGWVGEWVSGLTWGGWFVGGVSKQWVGGFGCGKRYPLGQHIGLFPRGVSVAPPRGSVWTGGGDETKWG